MAVKNSQVTDQTIKGVIVGAVAYGLAKLDVDPEFQAAIVPVVLGVLAWASTKVGDKAIASFFAKAAEAIPEVVEEVAKKKAPAKKAAPKKN